MTTEEAIYQQTHVTIDESGTVCEVEFNSLSPSLRHLISEARKVERVTAKYATLRPELGGENYDVAQAWDEGFHEAWEDVMAILSAPDTEGGA